MEIHRIYLNIALFISLAFLFGCKSDFLERPSDDAVEADFFFNTGKDLEVASNTFYSIFSKTGAYTDDVSSDNIVPLNPSDRVKGSRIVPTNRGSGGWSWSQLRTINFFLANYHKADDDAAKARYSGVAKFFRAYFYFEKVKRFGDVPWYSKVLEAGDPDLYKGRDSRQLVMDSVLVDIDYAIQNLPASKELNKVTKYTALHLKARIALHEGTFRKYHGIDGHQKFLQEAVDASSELMASGAYTLFTTGGAENAYRDLFARDNQDATETILAADFERGLEAHNLGYQMTSATMGSWGITKDLVNSYQMSDGSRFTDRGDYRTMEYFDEFQNRDPRLSQTTAAPDFVVKGESSTEPVNLDITTTGYRVIKALPPRNQWGAGSGSNFDIILYRYAETLLIFAEAKAELGELTQMDLDNSVNLIRARVGMPRLLLATANANPDLFLEGQYPNVDNGSNKGVILEIRRERRIELFNEGLRWDDLMRWKEGKKVEQPMVGIYFSGLGAHDFTGDGRADVFVHEGSTAGAPNTVTAFVNINQKQLRDPLSGNQGSRSGNIAPFPLGGEFDENRDYYYPLPIEELQLNPQLEQNPNW